MSYDKFRTACSVWHENCFIYHQPKYPAASFLHSGNIFQSSEKACINFWNGKQLELRKLWEFLWGQFFLKKALSENLQVWTDHHDFFQKNVLFVRFIGSLYIRKGGNPVFRLFLRI